MSFKKIIGKWPGDETDEQIAEAFAAMGKCRECETLRRQLAKARALYVEFCMAAPGFRQSEQFAGELFDRETAVEPGQPVDDARPGEWQRNQAGPGWRWLEQDVTDPNH